jgi:hypothetical protein
MRLLLIEDDDMLGRATTKNVRGVGHRVGNAA